MNGDPEEIEKLLTAVAFHDRGAFRELYEKSSSKLFSVCIRILRNEGEAEDALQEVFIKVWQKAPSFQQTKARGMTWLIAIARNESIDHLRSRRPKQEEIDPNEDLPDETPGPEAATAASLIQRKIHECLATLDNKHSEAIKQSYLNGWTYQEVADALKVPLNTVKTWIRRSLIALRECMNQ